MADEVDFEPDYDEDIAGNETEDVGKRGKGGGGDGGRRTVTKGSALRARPKGRGHTNTMDVEDRYEGRGGIFESVDGAGGGGPLRSVEGWIVFMRGVHEEAQEDDILDKFSEYGRVRNIHVNLDRRTGFVKGYALVEFEEKEEALEAIEKMNGTELLGQQVEVNWAFIKTPDGAKAPRRRRR